MKFVFVAFLLCSMLLTSTLARPQYKEVDFKLYGDDDAGVAVDAVYEIVNEDDAAQKHHHHHHHKKMAKSNRLDRLKRYLRGFEERAQLF